MVNFAIIEYHNYTFMITDSPTDNNLDTYLQHYQTHNVSTIVRLCESYYDSSIIENYKKQFIKKIKDFFEWKHCFFQGFN